MSDVSVSAGTKYPTSAVDLLDGGDHAGTYHTTWTNLTNIFVADDVNQASCDMPGGADTTDSIQAKGFGYNIPANAVIDGIMVEINAGGFRAADSGAHLNLGSKNSSVKNSGYTYGTLMGTYTYGGSTDTWGQSWTGAEINNANFSIIWGAHNTAGGGSVTVDFMRITVWWSMPIPAQDIDKNKYHIYKVYTPARVYLGNIPNVTSVYNDSQDINSTGGQIVVTVGATIDNSDQQGTEGLVAEDGTVLTDESGQALTTEGPTNISGLDGASAMLVNGNIVVVWEYSYYYPNGHVRFRGKIERQEDPQGGTDDNNITLFIYHDGKDMDQFLVEGAPFSYFEDQSNAFTNGSTTISTNADPSTGWIRVAQSFNVGGSGMSNVGGIIIALQGTATVTLKLYDTPAMLNLVGQATMAVATGSPTEELFSFAAPYFVQSGTKLFYTVEVAAGQSIAVFLQTTNTYASGGLFAANFTGTSGGNYNVQTGMDMYFRTYRAVGATATTYTSTDPTTGMVVPFMQNYVVKGGIITAPTGNIQATGLSLTYLFNTQTSGKAWIAP
jgi:hypothetical protein